MLEWEDIVAFNHEDKAAILLRYFSDAFGSTAERRVRMDLAAIGIAPTDLSHLDFPFSEDEVWNSIKDLPKDKSPGLDRFTAEFYCIAWSIIKRDIMRTFDFFYATNSDQLHLFIG